MIKNEKITKEEQMEILKEEFYQKELMRQKQEKELEIEIEVRQHRKVVAKNAEIQRELMIEGF